MYPLPSHSSSPMSCHARRRATGFCGKTQALTTRPKWRSLSTLGEAYAYDIVPFRFFPLVCISIVKVDHSIV